jgi:hypothetical protein
MKFSLGNTVYIKNGSDTHKSIENIPFTVISYNAFDGLYGLMGGFSDFVVYVAENDLISKVEYVMLGAKISYTGTIEHE